MASPCAILRCRGKAAELDGDLPGEAAQVVAGRGVLLFAFRLGEQATWRLLATRPATPGRLEPGSFGPPVSAIDLQALMDQAGLGARITDLRWSARVMVQRRLASRFRRGRLFLAGEAAHAFSPATGQGMNAAIQDAANLGWRLAFAAARNRSPGDERLLDSYDRERRPVARQLLALTNLAFWAEAGPGPVPSARPRRPGGPGPGQHGAQGDSPRRPPGPDRQVTAAPWCIPR